MWLRGVLIVIFCINLQEVIVQEIPNNQLWQNIYQEKCSSKSNNDPNAFLQFTEGLVEFQNCTTPFQTSMKNKMDLQSPLKDPAVLCEIFSNSNYYNCLVQLAEKIEGCLDAEEAYLPDFVLSTFNSSLKDACCDFNNFRIITELLKDDKCVGGAIPVVFNSCITPNLKIVNNIQKGDYVIRKDDLCSDFTSINECANDNLQKQCDKDYSEVTRIVFKPYLEWCKNN